MLGRNLTEIYVGMRDVGLTRSKRDFSRFWLRRGKTFLKDFEQRPERHFQCVSPPTVMQLRARLARLAALSSWSVRLRVEAIVDEIDSACRVAEFVSRGR